MYVYAALTWVCQTCNRPAPFCRCPKTVTR